MPSKTHDFLDFTFGDVVVDVFTHGRGKRAYTDINWQGEFDSKLFKRSFPFSVSVVGDWGEPTDGQRESFLWLRANETKLKSTIQKTLFHFYNEHWEEWQWDPIPRASQIWTEIEFDGYDITELKDCICLNFSVAAEDEHAFFVDIYKRKVMGTHFQGSGLGRKVDNKPPLPSRRFVFDDGSTRKFWNLRTDKKKLTVHFGRIGAAGQTKTKAFPNAEAMKAAADKLVAQKIDKGYYETSPPTG